SLELQFWLCMLYIIDYVVRFMGAPEKKRFFVRNILLLAISIPYLNIIYYYKITLNQEWITILRVLPVIRGGYAIVRFSYRVTRSRLSTLLAGYITFVSFISYFTTMIFFYAERGTNPMVNDYGDALWWTFMNLTTVGSNIYAVTTLGKFLSVMVAAVGMMMFPIFTAYITDIFRNNHARREQKKG
ncbi:MAG: potassium channel family protein, partial [Rikenellaceae bacterium]